MQPHKLWALSFLSLLSLIASATDHPKILIIYDMEGISGIVSLEHELAPGEKYALGRKSLTSDVNAAIRGLKAGGAGQIWIQDGHGSGNSGEPDLLVDELDPRAAFDFRTRPYFPYTTGIDASIDAVVCVGMHARAHTPGFLSHTYTPGMAVRVNGVEFTETHIIALSAARFGIPVIMVSGDNVLGEQLKQDFPDIEYAIVKTSRSITDTTPLTPVEVQKNIEGAARRALEKFLKGKFRPYYLQPPYDMEIQYDTWDQAQGAARVPGVEPNGDLGIRYIVQDFAQGIDIAILAWDMTNDRLTLLTRMLKQTPEGRKMLDRFWEVWEQRFLHPEQLPEWARPTPPPKKTRFFGVE